MKKILNTLKNHCFYRKYKNGYNYNSVRYCFENLKCHQVFFEKTRKTKVRAMMLGLPYTHLYNLKPKLCPKKSTPNNAKIAC